MSQLLLTTDKEVDTKVIKNGNGEIMFQIQAEKNFLPISMEKDEEDLRKRNLQVTLTMLLWVKKVVDLGYIMGYKAICNNCKGNGYEKIVNTKGEKNIHQCWMCESTGEIKWSQAKVDDFIYNTYFRKRV